MRVAPAVAASPAIGKDGDLLTILSRGAETAWLRASVSTAQDLGGHDGGAQIEAARRCFARFRAPLARLLGDGAWDGAVRSALLDWSGGPPQARVLVKADHALPMTGSIKARGGVHELLTYVERIGLATGLVQEGGDYAVLATPAASAVFADYEVSVASTGNLGFSIGLVGRAFGLRATVHMSHDAKAWKKARLRGVGASVVEHAGDYGQACAAARRASRDAGPRHHFVDDESSPHLFWGYAVAADELAGQLAERGIHPSPETPLVVYLPCGVGGAPGGITYGLKRRFGADVVCVFVEPTASPCVLAALASGSPAETPPSVYAFGLDNRTAADGLAVAQASSFVMVTVGGAIDAALSVSDEAMRAATLEAWRTGSLRLETSSGAGLAAIPRLLPQAAGREHWPDLSNAVHVAWATGGSQLPDAEWEAQVAGGAA